MPADTLYTAEEYLAFERASEKRCELVNGRIRPTPASDVAHMAIAGAIGAKLIAWLRDQYVVFSVFTSLMRVKGNRAGMYAYPDVVVIHGAPQLEDDYKDTLVNPTVIFEVYSDETEAFDRGEKFAQYRRSETLREYILVSQHEVRVELYRREGDRWRFSEITDREGVLDVETLGCEIPLAEIYGDVDLPPSRGRRG